jgi:hypothetical protein
LLLLPLPPPQPFSSPQPLSPPQRTMRSTIN